MMNLLELAIHALFSLGIAVCFLVILVCIFWKPIRVFWVDVYWYNLKRRTEVEALLLIFTEDDLNRFTYELELTVIEFKISVAAAILGKTND